MAVRESGITFIFDENLSGKLAQIVDHCGKNLTPPVRAEPFPQHLRSKPDLEWALEFKGKDVVILTSDRRMISDHSIAAFAKAHGLTYLFLSNKTDHMINWDLLKWLLTNLPKISRGLSKIQAGTCWQVGVDGGLHVVHCTDK